MQRIAVFLALALVLGVNADLYMQSPRGSNNRLNEANAERNNGNRLFDSQNNNRGGYNVGDKSNSAATTTAPSVTTLYDETDTTTAYQYPMVYYEQSVMQIEWTLQHGCGGNTITDPTLQNCNLVLQYTCDRTDDNDAALNVALRDGTTTNTVTTAGTDNTNGYHENAQYYSECNTRSRNQGLFLADQNLNGNTAIYTRQNPTGTRQGLECAEERDYYPYWLPTPFVDIAYLTDRLDFCSKQTTDPAGSKGYIADNSQNSSPKYKCYAATQTASTLNAKTRDTCAGLSGTWLSYTWNLPAPVCQQAQWSRSNHLGNSREGIHMMNYNWTLPSFTDLAKLSPTLYESGQYAKCVLRMRYNISTDDYDMWNINSTSNGATNSPVKDNGQVDIGASLQSLAMSINTDQFGRTFQDRSHTFYIKKRPAAPAALSTAKIVNLNVRGKRGNIVQTYPANEYDFVPNRFHVTGGSDYIHLQWTGSNTHNNGGGGGDGQAGDDGEGTDGTDRHNFVQIKDLGENFPIPLDKFANNFFSAVNCYKLDGTAINGGTANADCAVWLATSGYFRSAATVTGATGGGDTLSVTLDNAPASLIGGVLLAPKSTGAGVYNFIGSRNNNFSNRSQKGTIVIDAPAATSN